MPKTIEVTVDEDGSVTIEAQCFEGADCEKATGALAAALGVTKEKLKKPEYFKRQGQRQKA
jgi:hypothetical protein